MVKTGAELKLDFKAALKAKALLKTMAALLRMVAVKPKKAKPELRVAVRVLWQKKLRLKTHV
jgi:hypothetical protein